MVVINHFLSRWLPGGGADEAVEVSLSQDAMCMNDAPRPCPGAHLHKETSAYINGDITVLAKLPAVQASALQEALQSETSVVCPKNRTFVSRRQRKGLAQRQPPSPGHPPSQHATKRSTPTLPLVDHNPVFSEMVHREIRSSATQLTPQSRNVYEKPSYGPCQPSSISKSRTSRVPAISVHAGLRSCPPRSLADTHVWKRCPGPETEPKGEERNIQSCSFQWSTDRFEGSPIPSPTGLRTATEATWATPKVVFIPRRVTQTNPQPFLAVLPSPSPISPCPPSPPSSSLQNPTNSANSLPPNHYTTPSAARLLSTLRTHLTSLLHSANTPTGEPLPSTPAELLTYLLLKQPDLRRRLRAQNPRFAARVDMLDWRGVEADLTERSFARRCVEEWLRSGKGLFGGPKGGWEGEGEGRAGGEKLKKVGCFRREVGAKRRACDLMKR